MYIRKENKVGMWETLKFDSHGKDEHRTAGGDT
jgi:hypothetical protein